MRHIARTVLLVAPLALAAFVATTRAQDATQAKKQKTPSEALLENWNDIGKRLVTMAEDLVRRIASIAIVGGCFPGRYLAILGS